MQTPTAPDPTAAPPAPRLRLVESDLDDAHRANRELVDRLERDADLARSQFWAAFADTQIEPWHQPHTGGQANDSASNSAAALTSSPVIPAGHDDPDPDMWQLERDHTWLYWLYATVFTAAAAASVFWPWGVAP